MDTVQVNTETLRQLQEAQETLRALEAAGVDNWEGFSEALAPIRKRIHLRERIHEEIETLLADLSEYVDAPAGWQAGYGICGDGAFDVVISFLDCVDEIKKEVEENE